MAEWVDTIQHLPLWLHAVYLAAIAAAALAAAFHELTPDGWPVILGLLAIGALAMGAWCVFEHVTSSRKKEEGGESSKASFSLHELPPTLIVLPVLDVTLTGLTLTFSSVVDSIGWVITLLVLLLVMLALGLVSLIAFGIKQPPASPVKSTSRACDELSAWLAPIVYVVTVTIELIVIFCLALDEVPPGVMLVTCLLQLAVAVCAVLVVVWILRFNKQHKNLPVLKNFEDFIFRREESKKGATEMKTTPTTIYYLPIGPISARASEFESALQRFVAAKGGTFSLQQLPGNASSDVIKRRSVILVPCFQDGGANHLASDVRSVLEVAENMLAAHSPGVLKVWLVVLHRHSPEFGDIESTVDTLDAAFFEDFRRSYKSLIVFDVVYGKNGKFFVNATNTDTFSAMTDLLTRPSDV